jgi:hypothetical protein
MTRIANHRTATQAAAPPTRRDESHPPSRGHSKRLRAHPPNRSNDDAAFVRVPRTDEPFAEHLGEAFVQSATSGEDDEEEVLDAFVPEELGGPFVVTTSNVEFAEGVDESNPVDAEPAPFPKT